MSTEPPPPSQQPPRPATPSPLFSQTINASTPIHRHTFLLANFWTMQAFRKCIFRTRSFSFELYRRQHICMRLVTVKAKSAFNLTSAACSFTTLLATIVRAQHCKTTAALDRWMRMLTSSSVAFGSHCNTGVPPFRREVFGERTLMFCVGLSFERR